MASSNFLPPDAINNSLRSLLLSSKGGIPLHLLLKEYRDMIGEDIPLRDLGYSSIDQFVQNVPDICRISHSTNGTVMIHGIPTEKNAHIANMIALQKSKKSKVYSAPRRLLRFSPDSHEIQPRPPRPGVIGSGRIPQYRGKSSGKPVKSATPKSTIRPKPKSTSLQELGKYLEDNNFPPCEIKTAEIGSKKSRSRTYVSTVKVSDKSFQTFPQDYPTREQAEEAVAKLALDSLGLFVQPNTQLLSPSNIDIDAVAARMATIVGTKSNGVWSNKVSEQYKAKYKEQLPENWLNQIDSLRHHLQIMSPIDGFYIVAPCAKQEGAIVGESGSCANDDMVRPPSLTLPSDPTWDIYVTVVHNTASIVCRLMGPEYNEKFDDLCTEMELFYFHEKDSFRVTNPSIGALYAVKLDTDWYRAEVKTVDGDYVRVHFIDHGDEDNVPAADLRKISPKFLALPAQAKEMKLDGLEERTRIDEMASGLLRTAILGRSLIAEVVSRAEPCPSIILFDTSYDNDININEKIFRSLCDESSSFSRLSVGSCLSVFMSHVSDSGYVFVRQNSSNESSLEMTMIPVDETSNNSSNDDLCRASLLNTFATEGKADANSVEYCEQGAMDSSQNESKLIEFPYQIIKCLLSTNAFPSLNHRWTSRTTEKLWSIIPENKQILIKVLKTSDGVPEVELFEGSESLNNKLASYIDVFDNNGCDNLTSNVADAVNRLNVSQRFSFSDDILTSSTNLLLPEVPSRGQFFDVYVMLAASPSNFTIQPLNDAGMLQSLVSDMFKFYSKNPRHKLLNEHFKTESYFASIHQEDKCWYRVKVDRVINEQTVAIKYVDYGDCTVVGMEDLEPLYPEFRHLPMQAIKAALSDIVPTNRDWTPGDAMWFSQRTVNKQFVSIVKDVVNEEDGSLKIGVSLIDVDDPENDVDVGKQLVDDQRAVFLCI